MMKCRQVLEAMVDYLCTNAEIQGDNLAESIDILYSSDWISKMTCEHYHKIRLLGNKAAHEGNDNAYDANNAYHLLSKEVYTFAKPRQNIQAYDFLCTLCIPLFYICT